MQEFQIYGRLGNQMFQFANVYSTVCYKLKDKDYSLCFHEKIPEFDFDRLTYKPKEINRGVYGTFLGWNESEMYFEPGLARTIYSPSNEKIRHFLKKYGDLKNSLLIPVRRGDFVALKDKFLCCNAKYYEFCYKMLTQDGKKHDKVLITSDDFDWCRENLKFTDNVIYLDDETPFDTIQLASLCKDFIINTSTFSWWCAWLGEQNGGKILCPNKKFLKGFEKENKIFFPERWTKIEPMEGLYEI